jgi:Na+/H+ antiporter NhaC
MQANVALRAQSSILRTIHRARFLPNSYFILSSVSAIFRASYRNPDEANTFGERLSAVMDELNLPLAA